MPLNGKQKRRLRALGHHLGVVVQVGSNGVTPGVIAATEQALKDHELIKVKIADEREGRGEAIDALVKGTGAEVAQTLGRTVLLFKKRAKKSKFAALFTMPPLPGSEPVADEAKKPAKARTAWTPVEYDAPAEEAADEEVGAFDDVDDDSDDRPVEEQPEEQPAPKARRVAAKPKAAAVKAPKKAAAKKPARPAAKSKR